VLVAVNADQAPHNAHLKNLSGRITDLLTGEEKELSETLALPAESTGFYKL